MYTVDTNVVIYYLKDDGAAVSFFDQVADLRTPVFVAGVSETELLSFGPLTENDIAAIEKVLLFCTTIHTNPHITRLAGELRRTYGVKTIDALVAATAIFTNSTLITRNVRDFVRIKELVVKKI